MAMLGASARNSRASVHPANPAPTITVVFAVSWLALVLIQMSCMVKGWGVLLWCWLDIYDFNIRLGNATIWTRPRMRDIRLESAGG
jgi:hypothetical protein